MKISNGVTEDRFCGDQLSGRDLLVSGNHVVLTFHSDWRLVKKRGFEIFFASEIPCKFKKVSVENLNIVSLFPQHSFFLVLIALTVVSQSF